jgi:hypothetical protein
MKNNRRNFLKLAGMAGAGMMVNSGRSESINALRATQTQTFNMHGYAAPKLDTVRVGLIGVGSRGSGTLQRLASIEGVEIKAICDLLPGNASAAIKSISAYKHKPDSYSGGEEEWKKVCDRKDIDLIYIATPWDLHAPIAIRAMQHDKHVYTELPVATTIEDCWAVVETSEQTRKHCFMGCGSCHDGKNAAVLNMARDGFFGDLIHGEGHYIHDRVSGYEGRWVRDKDGWYGYRPWRLKENIDRNGNLYPQHGLGPVAQLLDLNYGDQMDYMVSVSGNDFSMGTKMKELAAKDAYFEPYVGLKFRGNMNTTVIRTHKGRTIMLQHDISTPRPGERFKLISGTKGMYNASPSAIATGEEWLPQEEYDALMEKYTPAITDVFKEKLEKAGGQRGNRSYERVTASDWRLIDCLRNGLPLEMDVYDAALWTSITPLSEWSVSREGSSIKVPDFTRGAWKTNKRGMDVLLQKGGSTNLVKLT